MDAPARVIQKVTFFKILFKEYSKSKSLKEIHQKNVIHCDIKPKNIIFKKEN